MDNGQGVDVKAILQHCTTEQKPLFDLTRPFNESYANRLEFSYLVSDGIRRCPNRSIYWEKIAYLNEILPTLPDSSLVVWLDADSICVKDVSFENALPTSSVFGMVQMRGGLDGMELINWWNAGVLVIENSLTIRDFFHRVWVRAENTDESAMVAELKLHGMEVGDGLKFGSLHPKWNSWKNNTNICKDAVVKSWHGIRTEQKLSAIEDYIKNIRG